MKKLLSHEALVFFCSLMFGTVVLPVFTFVLLSFFGLMPQNSSLAECYDALKALLGPNQWIFWVMVFSPVVIVQVARVIQWRRRGGPWFIDPDPENLGSKFHTSGNYCEFSLMTWRDGLPYRDEPETAGEKDNG